MRGRLVLLCVEEVAQAHRVVALGRLSKVQALVLQTVAPVDILADVGEDVPDLVPGLPVDLLLVEARAANDLLGAEVPCT